MRGDDVALRRGGPPDLSSPGHRVGRGRRVRVIHQHELHANYVLQRKINVFSIVVQCYLYSKKTVYGVGLILKRTALEWYHMSGNGKQAIISVYLTLTGKFTKYSFIKFTALYQYSSLGQPKGYSIVQYTYI